MNLTIEAPAGSTNHGNPKLLCVPPKAIDYLIFYVANYFAHAASIVIEPGQSLPIIISCVFMALLMPGSGIARALMVIVRCPIWENKNDGQRAARAGALCMVVKKTDSQSPLVTHLVGKRGEFGILNKFKTPNDLEHELATIEASQTGNDEQPYEEGLEIPKGYSYMPVLSGTSIHGHRALNKEFHRYFYIGMVPAFATLQLTPAENVESSSEFENPKPLIASSISLVRPFIGLIQAVWGVITLYRARGNQVEEYGYAAFGLTVAPYVMMSVLNSLANMLTPVYPSMFLINTKLLRKVQEQEIASFSGVVNAKSDITTIEPSIQLRLLRGFMAGLDNSLIPPKGVPFWKIGFTDFVLKFLGLGSHEALTRAQSNTAPNTAATPFWNMGLTASDIKFLGISGFYNAIRETLLWSFSLSDSDLKLFSPGLILGLVPLAIIGSISGFQNGNSTAVERGFTMSWFVVGLGHGLVMGLQETRVGFASYLEYGASRRHSARSFVLLAYFVVLFLAVFGPAVIGGMVIVGKMIRSFGICTRIA